MCASLASSSFFYQYLIIILEFGWTSWNIKRQLVNKADQNELKLSAAERTLPPHSTSSASELGSQNGYLYSLRVRTWVAKNEILKAGNWLELGSL